MGTGTYLAGKFNLKISFRYAESAAGKQEWRMAFEHASRMLYDATDGQHQLGKIYVCNNSTGSNSADFWINPADQAASSEFFGIRQLGRHTTLYTKHRFRPFIILHECGHYLYDLGDEYSGLVGPNPASCMGIDVAGSCIMECGFPVGDRWGQTGNGGPFVSGTVSEFCVPSNHDLAGVGLTANDTSQQQRNHESCWATMKRKYPDLTLPVGSPAIGPVAGTPGSPAPVGWTAPTWIELLSQQRFILLIDRSGSMSGNKIQEAKYGADWWADESVIGDHVGMVSFSDSVSVDFSLRAINVPNDRTLLHNAVAAVVANGATAIGDGLRTSLNQILAAGAPAATQIIVLLTDGISNWGEDPLAVLPDLVANGVRVYVVGIGIDINAVLLNQIATDTGGEFYRINPSLSTSDQELQIRQRLQTVSGLVQNNGGIVTFLSLRFDPEENKEFNEDLLVELGTEIATFGISWKNPEENYILELMSPIGEKIVFNTQDDRVRLIYSRRPYMGFQIISPTPGEWKVNIIPETINFDENSKVDLIQFSQNPHISGGLSSLRTHYNVGEQIVVNLRTYYDVRLTNLKITSIISGPSEELPLIEFHDVDQPEGSDNWVGEGLYAATFQAPKNPGVYLVEVRVESDGETTKTALPERPPGDDSEISESIVAPEFQREFLLTLVVGEEQNRSFQVKPNSAYPGDKIEAVINGSLTHFEQDMTFLNFGQGITMEDIRIDDRETITALLSISEDAAPGPRNVIANSPDFKERIEAEGGFWILPPTEPNRDLPDWIDRLVLNRDRRLVALQVKHSQELIEVPPNLEPILRKLLDFDEISEAPNDAGSHEKTIRMELNISGKIIITDS